MCKVLADEMRLKMAAYPREPVDLSGVESGAAGSMRSKWQFCMRLGENT